MKKDELMRKHDTTFDILMNNLKISYPKLYESIADAYVYPVGCLTFIDYYGNKYLYNDVKNKIRRLPSISECLTNEFLLKDFAERFEMYMHYRGYNLTKLAQAIGIAQPNISNYVNGNTMPSVLTLKKFAAILKCRVDDLIYTDIFEE